MNKSEPGIKLRILYNNNAGVVRFNATSRSRGRAQNLPYERCHLPNKQKMLSENASQTCHAFATSINIELCVP